MMCPIRKKSVSTKILLTLIVLMSLLVLLNAFSLKPALKSGVKGIKHIGKKPISSGTPRVPSVKARPVPKPLPSADLTKQNMDKVIEELKQVLAKRQKMKINLPKNLP
uniref:Hypothetical secreted peptide n=1 Tax=Simulium nigrimanum TaxID=683695 RepID=D1FPU3_SIMNI